MLPWRRLASQILRRTPAPPAEPSRLVLANESSEVWEFQATSPSAPWSCRIFPKAGPPGLAPSPILTHTPAWSEGPLEGLPEEALCTDLIRLAPGERAEFAFLPGGEGPAPRARLLSVDRLHAGGKVLLTIQFLEIPAGPGHEAVAASWAGYEFLRPEAEPALEFPARHLVKERDVFDTAAGRVAFQNRFTLRVGPRAMEEVLDPCFEGDRLGRMYHHALAVVDGRIQAGGRLGSNLAFTLPPAALHGAMAPVPRAGRASLWRRDGAPAEVQKNVLTASTTR